MMIKVMVKGKIDMKPLLVNIGVVLALSFAEFLYTRIRTKHFKTCHPTPPISECDEEVDYDGRSSVKDDPHSDIDIVDQKTYFQELTPVHTDPSLDLCIENKSQEDLAVCIWGLKPTDIETFDVRNLSKTKSNNNIEKDDYKQEIDNLNERINYLVERLRNVEVQLLEYYGLKEQESVIMELQNCLEIRNIETKLLTMKIEKLEARNKWLAEKVNGYSKVVSELEAAKVKIKELKREIWYEAKRNEEWIFDIKQSVERLQGYEDELRASQSDDQFDLCEVIEDEIENLQQENTDFNFLFQDSEIEDLHQAKLELIEENEKLKAEVENEKIEDLHQAKLQLIEENEKLKTEVERLESNSRADELVYQRWVNACLRYDLREYEPLPSQTRVLELTKYPSPQSILNYGITEHDIDDQNQRDQTSLMCIDRSLSFDYLAKSLCEAEEFMSRSNPQYPKFATSSQNPIISLFEYLQLERLEETDENTSKIKLSRSLSLPGEVRCVLGKESMEGSSSSPLHYASKWIPTYGKKFRFGKVAQVWRDNKVLPKHKKSASYHA